jgi:signal peptidase II
MTETTEGKTAFPKVSAAPSSHCRFWLTITVILVSDQLSKWVIVDLSGFKRGLYPPFGGVELIPGFFNLVYAVNYGAAWGMLEGYSWLLVALAVLVLVLIGVFRKDLALHERPQQWCFGLIAGGILGNTIDRIFRGHVVDFLDFHLPMYRWPTFNIADSAIVVGTLWYIYLQFRPIRSKTS